MIGHHGRVYQMPLVGQNVLFDDERRTPHLSVFCIIEKILGKGT